MPKTYAMNQWFDHSEGLEFRFSSRIAGVSEDNEFFLEARRSGSDAWKPARNIYAEDYLVKLIANRLLMYSCCVNTLREESNIGHELNVDSSSIL